MRSLPLAVALVVFSIPFASGAEFPRFEPLEIDPHIGEVCYAVTTADVNGDGKLDVVAVSEDAVVWYENPSWRKHEAVRGATKRDNVCIQAHDVDGDGRIDFTVGAGWKPPDTAHAGTLQWIGRDAAGEWQVHPIDYDEPSLHRLRWGDVKGNGKKQLVVAPLQGRGTKPPNWDAGHEVRVLVLDVPGDPAHPHWPTEVADASLHTIHNLQLVDMLGAGRDQIVLAAWEGVYRLERSEKGKWTKAKLGAGDQESAPFKGASEVKVGRLADGSHYLATIEPWHGNQVVVYTPPKQDGDLWQRQVVATPLAWGHAVWCANLDGDGDDELIIGQRDRNPADAKAPRGPGVFAFDPRPSADGLAFERHAIDDGGMACEDAVAADLDGDGRIDVVAGGRATHNLRIYWNQPR
ncbi:MAG: VCBS repeat-containing protein [Paludisphaera borealis]|uniref:FG-GAP repeat domain-containing protein n=1 Tax=Paludisphaera borealis TaxID=1387353 RepID=UPI00284AEA36|nr:VCBS repeat-containing protein [Paludisphaera borealis]MDR3620050.1 VCBS repeat-containing protein [Paludisphaera borealis]